MNDQTTSAHRRQRTIPLILALCIALGSCDAGDVSTMEVAVYANNTRDRHPAFPDSIVVGNNSLVDSAGLAGLEVRVMGRTLTAEDLAFGSSTGTQWDVDESGQVQVSVRLAQQGRFVAEGDTSWSLRPKTDWLLVVSRGIAPPKGGRNYSIDDVTDPGCESLAIQFCDGVLRMRIEDSAANFLEEGLWLLWVGVDSDPPDGIVYSPVSARAAPTGRSSSRRQIPVARVPRRSAPPAGGAPLKIAVAPTQEGVRDCPAYNLQK